MIVLAGLTASIAFAVPAFAATNSNGRMGWGQGMHGKIPGIFGTVAAISGNTITVTGMTRPNSTTAAVTYTVDAANAKVTKNGIASTVSGIVVGDTVMVQGTVNGANVTATAIRDGMMGRGQKSDNDTQKHGQTLAVQIQGNGQPVVGGSITAINGTILTITNKSNVTYTVDTTNAKIVKAGQTSSLSNLAVGDNVIVQGTVNGTSIAASSIIDQGGAPNGTPTNGPPAGRMGIFGSIKNFFGHLFGF